jgi:hypothetical protein
MDLGVKNIFDTKNIYLGECLRLAGYRLVASLKRIACCHGLNGHVEKLELNDT